MYLQKISKLIFSLILVLGFSFSAVAADYNLRMTMNSNDQDEDYDGSVVFKNYVEAASNGAISVELFVGTQLCSKGACERLTTVLKAIAAPTKSKTTDETNAAF